MPILNKTTGTIIVEKETIADTSLSRMVGLLKHKSLPREEGLVITHCNSIHMFFMKFPIDVIFVDKTNHIVGLVREIKPFRLSRIYFKASYAIEVASGIIKEKNVSVGHEVCIQP